MRVYTVKGAEPEVSEHLSNKASKQIRQKKMPRMGFPYGHFVDSKCLRAGPRGFCLSPKGTIIGSNKNIAPVFKSQRRQSSLPACVAKFFKKICPAWDLNPYHRFRRPVLYPVELTGRKKSEKSQKSKNNRIYFSIFFARHTVLFLISKDLEKNRSKFF